MSKRPREREDGTPSIALKKRRATVAAAKDAKLQMCSEILEELKNAEAEDGHLLTEAFMKAPSRRTNADYYKLISSPIDFMRIQQKVRTEEYPDVTPFAEDMKLLVENAKTYYKRTSPEYKDACDLMDAFTKIRTNVEGTEGAASRDASPAASHVSFRSNSPTRSIRSKDASPGRVCAAGNDPVHKTVLQELLASVMQVTDDTGRMLSPPFRHLPSKEELPEYYGRIKDPIDLRMIAEKIDGEKYTCLNEIEKDLLLLFKNAKLFNEPGSMIHKDSSTLRKFAMDKKMKLLENAMVPLEEATAEENRKVVNELMESAEGGDLEEFSEDSEEDEERTSKSAHPMHKLYWALRNYSTRDAPQITPADAFVALPSKQCYPDYYEEVPNPISFYMINKRIKNAQYATFGDMVKDLNIMFENAKSYNLDGSEIHKHACCLQAYGNLVAIGLDPTLDLRGYPIGKTEPMSPIKPSTPVATSTPAPKRRKIEKPVDPDKPKGKPGRKTMGELMDRYRNKLLEVYNSVSGFKDFEGRWVGEAFMEKPLKSEYPDYYTAIPNPIDLKTIKEKIEKDQYDSSAQLADDFNLLFENAKHYNEDGSKIFNDADILKNKFENACKILGPVVLDSPKHIKEKFGWAKATLPAHQKRGAPGFQGIGGTPGSGPKKQILGTTTEADKMTALLDELKHYTDSRGRRLSLIFLQLPSRKDYPDYYEVIKRPIDLQRVQARLSQNLYDNMEALVADCTLMFDNACRYNEPDSVIYKDALTLQRVLLQKKAELRGSDSSSAPNAMACVQELLKNLFITVYNHQDAEGRCYIDSMAELQETNKSLPEEKRKQFIPLDVIKRNLDKGRYLRLDRFQDDMFNTFNCARQISRTDSQLFEDATELQAFFIQTRNDLCKDGEYFNSPAMSFTDRHLVNLVEEMKMNKMPLESKEGDTKTEDPTASPSKKKAGDTELSSVTVGEVEYKVGDFCYVQPSDPKQTENHIIRIERLWKDSSTGQTLINGNWFHKPKETFHLATRKFLEKEVFKSRLYDNVTQNRLKGKCYVMLVRDYFKYKPKGFNEEDVYVCESRYLGRMLHFKKIKIWPFEDDGVELEERAEPLVAKRMTSGQVMANVSTVEQDGPKEDSSDDDDDNVNDVIDKERMEVVCEKLPENASADFMYFEQVLIKEKWWVKLGDAVFVCNADKEVSDIVRVDRLWRNKENATFLCGQWFARPFEVEHEPCRMFYKREVFCTDKCDVTHSVDDVLGVCQVLPFKDYVTFRPSEYPEENVFVCAHQLNSNEINGNGSTAFDDSLSRDSLSLNQPVASESCAKKLTSKSMKFYKLSTKVLEDEMYYFKKPYQPEKVPSPFLAKLDATADIDNLSEFADNASEFDRLEASCLTESKSWLAGQPKLSTRSKSGYILYSAEVRKKIMQDNPGVGFGETSKLVGVAWKKLGEEAKKEFEMRAQVIAEERRRVDALKPAVDNTNVPPGQYRIYVCKWRDCTHQFSTPELLYEHIINVHTSQIAEAGENQFVCYWASCIKYHKGGKSFPSLPRLHRHMKEKHLPSAAKNILPHQRSKNFFPPNYFPEPVETAPSPRPASQQQHAAPQHGVQHGMQPPQQHQFYAQHPQQHPGISVQHEGAGQQQMQHAAPVAHPGYQYQHAAQPGQHPSVMTQPADPGRTVLELPKDAEPVFVAPPNSQKVQRVLHSETYLRYIESLHAQPAQQSVTRFNRYLGATTRNTAMPHPEPGKPPLPLAWFGNLGSGSKEDVINAIWKLRDHMMKDTYAIHHTLNEYPQ